MFVVQKVNVLLSQYNNWIDQEISLRLQEPQRLGKV